MKSVVFWPGTSFWPIPSISATTAHHIRSLLGRILKKMAHFWCSLLGQHNLTSFRLLSSRPKKKPDNREIWQFCQGVTESVPFPGWTSSSPVFWKGDCCWTPVHPPCPAPSATVEPDGREDNWNQLFHPVGTTEKSTQPFRRCRIFDLN